MPSDNNPEQSFWDKWSPAISVISGVLGIASFIAVFITDNKAVILILVASLFIFLISIWVYSRLKPWGVFARVGSSVLLLFSCILLLLTLPYIRSNRADIQSRIDETQAAASLSTSFALPSPPTPTRPPKVDIKFESWKDFDDSTNRMLTNLISDTRQITPAITVIGPSFIPFEKYADLISQDLKLGQPDDVFAVPELGIKDLLDAKQLHLLDEYLTDEFKSRGFYPKALDYFRDTSGHLYGIPRDMDLYALLYDKEAFKKAGYDEVPQIWEQYEAALQKLSKQKEGQYGLCIPDGFFAWLTFYYQSPGATLVKFDSSRAVTAAERLERLYRNGLAATPVKLGLPSCVDALIQHRVASSIGTRRMFEATRAITNSQAIGTIDIPHDIDRATLMFVEGYAMWSGATYPQDAWRLIAYLTNVRAITQWNKVTKGIPPIEKLAQQQSEKDPTIRPFIDGAGYAKGDELRLISLASIGQMRRAAVGLEAGQYNAQEFVAQLKQRLS